MMEGDGFRLERLLGWLSAPGTGEILQMDASLSLPVLSLIAISHKLAMLRKSSLSPSSIVLRA